MYVMGKDKGDDKQKEKNRLEKCFCHSKAEVHAGQSRGVQAGIKGGAAGRVSALFVPGELLTYDNNEI